MTAHIETNIAYLPNTYRCAIERLDCDPTLRTAPMLRELCDAYARGYGILPGADHDRYILGALYICGRRFGLADCAAEYAKAIEIA